MTPDGIDNAAGIRISAVRHQVALQRAGTVRNGLVASPSASRRQIITSSEAFGPAEAGVPMALYFRELEPAPVRKPDASAERGAIAFADDCASCHCRPAQRPSVPIDIVGTDPAVGTSPDRRQARTGCRRLSVGDRNRLRERRRVRRSRVAERRSDGEGPPIRVAWSTEKADLILLSRDSLIA